MTWTPGCGPDCPCQISLDFTVPWVVFSTGQRYELVELRMGGRARARRRDWRWFRWVVA